ncbi:acyl-CoA dehydrogenase [Pseudomonas farris]
MESLILSRRDLSFLLYEWLEVENLLQRPRFADHSRETIDAALDTYESIATRLFAPHNKANDQYEPSFDGKRVTVNPAIAPALKAFADAGLMAACQDYELGGMQLPSCIERAGFAYLVAANAASIAYAFLTIANLNLQLAHGSTEQIRRYVQPMLQGRFFGTMCLSEPQAGSSLADIRTRAVAKDDGSYRLFGNKMWISAGEHEIAENIVHLVLAKIQDADGQLPAGVGGISLFVVPKYLIEDDSGALGPRNDVVLAGLNHKMGYRGTTNCLLNFGEGKHLPGGHGGAVGHLVGEPGSGLAYMFHMMNEARIGVGLGAAALGYTGYLHALDYARSRPQGRTSRGAPAQTPIIGHADVRRMLLAQKAYAEGGMALVLFCARLSDEQQTDSSPEARKQAEYLLDLLTPIAKSWPSQWCLAANDLAIQVHGGYGYTRDYNVEQFYRDNRLNPIHEGTHGIQGLDLLGRKVNQHEGAGLRLLGQRIEQTVEAASVDGELAGHGRELEAVWTRLVNLTVSLNACEDSALRLANASAYLELFGHVVLAWIWLSQAVAVSRDGSPADADFRAGKRQACHYFFQWELPKTSAWFAVLDLPDDTCLNMRDAWF